MRLDSYLVEKNLIDSRNRAQSTIKNSLVLVDGKVVTKASFKVNEDAIVTLLEHKSYVSRAAFKLLDFLDTISLDVAGLVALDVGSSTGGFTEVLLEKGVESVTCVDVGKEQLHHSLREHAKVDLYESCDIRDFTTQKHFNLVVSDVSFISLHYILDAIDTIATDKIILLFKPQFEVGREAKRDKNGVVLDKHAIANAMVRFEDATLLKGWKLIEKTPSSITGKEGNLEYCYLFKKSI